MATKNSQDSNLLEMALIGYQVEKSNIETKIREIQALLKGNKPAAAHATAAPVAGKPRKTRRMSAAGRARIAAAQKKRWADYHKTAAASS